MTDSISVSSVFANSVVAAVDLDLGPGLDVAAIEPDDATLTVALDVEHRVDEQVDTEVVAVERHPYRVDEERAVVGHDEEHRPERVEAVVLRLGGHDADDRPARRANTTQVEVGDGALEDNLELAVVDVELGELVVVAGQELGEDRVVGMTGARHLGELVERGRQL